MPDIASPETQAIPSPATPATAAAAAQAPAPAPATVPATATDLDDAPADAKPLGDRQLIQQGKSRIDDTRLPAADDATVPADDAAAVVTFRVWLDNHEVLRTRRHPVGIVLAPDDEAEQLATTEAGTIDPAGIAFIAVEFPNMTDGRGFSQGQLLRTRLGWTGEMRAIGDVLADTMFYLSRCGFDSYSLKPGQDAELALRALSTFSTSYQRGYRSSVAASA